MRLWALPVYVLEANCTMCYPTKRNGGERNRATSIYERYVLRSCPYLLLRITTAEESASKENSRPPWCAKHVMPGDHKMRMDGDEE